MHAHGTTYKAPQRGADTGLTMCFVPCCSDIGITNSTTAGDGSDNDLALSVGAIVGVVLGGLAVLLSIVFVLGVYQSIVAATRLITAARAVMCACARQD